MVQEAVKTNIHNKVMEMILDQVWAMARRNNMVKVMVEIRSLEE